MYVSNCCNPQEFSSEQNDQNFSAHGANILVKGNYNTNTIK